jgi:hypothetical protein
LIVAEKNVAKNILDGRKDRGKTVYPPPPPGTGGIIRNGAKKISKKQSKHNMSPETSFGGHNKKRSKHNKIWYYMAPKR